VAAGADVTCPDNPTRRLPKNDFEEVSCEDSVICEDETEDVTKDELDKLTG
jgi:hypothetical protein